MGSASPPAYGGSGIKEVAMLDEATLRARLQRHWEFAGTDQDITHEIYHADAVLEFPQSGERFEGVHSFKPWRERYPARLRFHIRRITHRQDVVVVEYLIGYDDAPWQFVVNIMEFRGEKVARERIYIMDGWEPPPWRAEWRASTLVDRPLPA
ncbi:nuclear transport factor 2 family protein, partial [Oryzihumus sp.]|uniref:nuclear transport factor 2 family protein n=1 Tax=Oryzihumus sp. TaxID=1968903 RepID=UPI002EDAEFCE